MATEARRAELNSRLLSPATDVEDPYGGSYPAPERSRVKGWQVLTKGRQS
jgi:hypothetical protein